MLNQAGIDLPESPSVLGRWRLDANRFSLVYGAQCHRLEPRVMATLQVLIAHAGKPVDRERLIETVWGHQHVTDDALNRCIAQLRKTFADMSDAPRIETLPKVGYALHPPEPGRSSLRSTPVRVALLVAAIAIVVLWWSIRSNAPVAEPLPRLTPLTSEPGMEIGASFSPDGSQVAYAHQAEGGTWRILVRTVGLGNPRSVSEGPGEDLSPAWSPDGRTIAFLRFDEAGCTVMGVPPTGGPARRLSPCHPRSDHGLAWSPDSRRLIFTPVGTGPRVLAWLDLASGRIEVITRPAAGEIGDARPALSTSGDRLAFTRWHDYGVGDLFLVDLRNEALRRLTHDGLKIHGATWLDDGAIVFGSNRGGHFGLWRIDPAGEALAPLPLASREIDGPAAGAAGRLLAFEEWQDRADIVRYPLEGAPVSHVASTRWDWGPRLSPDGRRLAFVSDRTGSAELWISDADGGRPRQLTHHGGAYTNRPAWSADGQWLVYEAPLEGQFDLYRISAEGGAARRLTVHPASDRYPRLSPDGQWLYFGSRRSGEWAVYRLDTTDPEAAPERVTEGSVAQPHGRWLYVSDCRDGGLWRQDMANGQREDVLGDLSPIDCAEWVIREDRLHAIDRESGQEPVLVSMTLDPVTVEGRRALPGFRYGAGLDVLGDEVLATRVIQKQSDLMLLERGAAR